MMGGIDTQVQQRVDSYRDNPQALMQRYQQQQELIDLLAMQKLKSEKEEAARQMQMQMPQQPQTIKEQREAELKQLSQQEIAKTLGMGMPSQAAPQQGAPQQGRPQQGMPPQAAPQQSGIAGLPTPPMQGMASGGVVSFAQGGLYDPDKYRPKILEALNLGATPEMVAQLLKITEEEVFDIAGIQPGTVTKGDISYGEEFDESTESPSFLDRLSSGIQSVTNPIGDFIETAIMGDVDESSIFNRPILDMLSGVEAPEDLEGPQSRAQEMGRGVYDFRQRAMEAQGDFLNSLAGRDQERRFGVGEEEGEADPVDALREEMGLINREEAYLEDVKQEADERALARTLESDIPSVNQNYMGFERPPASLDNEDDLLDALISPEYMGFERPPASLTNEQDLLDAMGTSYEDLQTEDDGVNYPPLPKARRGLSKKSPYLSQQDQEEVESGAEYMGFERPPASLTDEQDLLDALVPDSELPDDMVPDAEKQDQEGRGFNWDALLTFARGAGTAGPTEGIGSTLLKGGEALIDEKEKDRVLALAQQKLAASAEQQTFENSMEAFKTVGELDELMAEANSVYDMQYREMVEDTADGDPEKLAKLHAAAMEQIMPGYRQMLAARIGLLRKAQEPLYTLEQE